MGDKLEKTKASIGFLNDIMTSMSDIVVSAFINDPTVKYLLDFYYQQAKNASEIGNAIAFIDSVSVIVWTLSAGALSLTGIIGAFAALGYQTRIEQAQKIYEAFYELKDYNDPSIPFDPSEDAVRGRVGIIRKHFAAYHNRRNSLVDYENSGFWQKWWWLMIPFTLLWVIGLTLMLIRWTIYVDVHAFPLLSGITWISILAVLVLMWAIMNHFVTKMEESAQKLPSIQYLLDVGINNEIDSLQHLLNTVGVYVVLTDLGGKCTWIVNTFSDSFYKVSCLNSSGVR